MIARGLIVTMAMVLIAAADVAADTTSVPMPTRLRISDGDPEAVPLILAGLKRIASDASSVERSDRLDWFAMAAAYNLEAAGPLMAAFARQRDVTGGEMMQLGRSAMQFNSAAALPFQRSLLADERLTDVRVRVGLLSKLAEHDDLAADALADWAIAELRQPKRSDGTVGVVLVADLPYTRSARLLERLQAFPVPQAKWAAERRASLIDALTLTQKSDAEVLAALRSAKVEENLIAIYALHILERRGDATIRAEILNGPIGEKNRLITEVEAWRRPALLTLRRRHWQHEPPTTRPAAER